VTRPTGKLERLCYARQERDLALAARLEGHPRGFRFDAAAGERAVMFIDGYCRHHKGEWAGKPLLLGEWQKWIVRTLFGWLRPDGTRRYRKAWIEIARKNGKTELAAAIALYMLIADGEAGAEVYTTATTKEQALICHESAREMVRASPELARFVAVPKAKHANLVCERLGSKMQILASDYGTLDGKSPSGDIRDEVHAWTDERLAAVLDTATGARRQPLTLEITTAGTYDQTGVGWQHHKYAVDVLESAVQDDRLFVFIAAIDDADDWRDPAVWAKANPNLGISPKLDYIAEQVEEAKQNPAKINDVLRLHFNRWTQQVERWLSLERWIEAEDSSMREDDLLGVECVGGLDLAEKVDLCAFVLVPKRGDRVDLVCRFWLPEAQVEIQARKGRPFLRQWVQEGWLKATPGEVIDHALIRREINELRDRGFKFVEIAFDARSATQIATQLGDEDGFTMVDVRQGTLSLSEPSKLFEAAILERKARATGAPGGPNPIMRWMVGNATKRADVNMNIAPDKKRSKDKIDGISATVTALSRIVGGPQDEKPSGSYLDTSEPLLV
jgi:phage terminase large subunit-like protein